MSSSAKSEFFALVRDRFAPELRSLGFKGSGQNFRRIQDDLINTVNIQGNKYGGSVAVNLGVHLVFLPVDWCDEMPDPSKIKEVNCVFRDRLAPGNRSDYWWKYEGLFRSPVERVEHMLSTFLKYGEPKFQKFDSVEKVAGMYTPEEIDAGSDLCAFGWISPVGAALVMAEVNHHLSRSDTAKEFARVGLRNIGCASSARPRFEAILGET